MEFYILDGLTCDILLGEDFLEQVSAFVAHQDAFANAYDDEDIRELNTIRLYNRLEMGIDRLINRRGIQTSPQAEDGEAD